MKILFVTAHAPYPTHTGSGQRSCLLYNALSLLGDVKTITLESASAFTDHELSVLKRKYNLIGTGPTTQLGTTGLWRWIHKLNRKAALSIAHNVDGSNSRFKADSQLIENLKIYHHLKDCDVIVGRYTHSLTRLGLINTGKPTFLDVDDLASDIYYSRLNVTTNIFEKILLRRHYRNIKRLEADIFRSIDGLWVVNTDNRKVLGLENAKHLPNIPFVQRSSETKVKPFMDQNKIIASVAAYKHQPNVEGVQWFLDSVWSIVRTQKPNSQFYVFGSNLDKATERLWQSYDGVTIVGFVQDIGDAYMECAITICPVLRGAGTNIKVVESGAYGRNCVLTEFAARGYCSDQQIAPYLLIARDNYHMAEILINLLNNPVENRRSAENFRLVVEQKFSLSVFNETVKETLLTVSGAESSVS